MIEINYKYRAFPKQLAFHCRWLPKFLLFEPSGHPRIYEKAILKWKLKLQVVVDHKNGQIKFII